MILWHYTNGINLKRILEVKCIRPATTLVPKCERPVVWFSSNQEWEPTATALYVKKVVGGQTCLVPEEEAEAIVKGVWRIGVEQSTAPHGWERLVFLSHMHPAVARGLESAAKAHGADPSEWFGTFHPVTSDKWMAVQKRVDGMWCDLEDLVEGEEKQAGFEQKPRVHGSATQ